MPIRNFPFLQFTKSAIPRPFLPIKIINPHTGRSHSTYGLIDTGADDCAVPAYIAPILGRNLESGSEKSIITGNGAAIAFAHTTRFEIYDPHGDLAHTVQDALIDFMPNLNIVLLGVKSFLGEFVLNIDYPNQVFSITLKQG